MNSKSFWDKAAEKYATRPVSNEAAYAATLDIARGYFDPDASLLELGCGTGSTALRLADSAATIVGTDISPNMVEIAQSKAMAAGVQNVSFRALPAQADAGGPYDAILAFNLLHLLDNVPEVLAQAHRMLKSGGVLVTKSGCLGDGKTRLLWLPIALMRLIGKAPDVAFIKAAQLDQMMVDAGFVVERAEMLPEGSVNRLIVARKT